MVHPVFQLVEVIAKKILESVPKPIDIEMVMKKYPVMYEESMNTVVVQEVIRYARCVLCVVSERNYCGKCPFPLCRVYTITVYFLHHAAR